MPDDFLRRFCGSPDECVERLCQLIGLSHLVIVGGSRDIAVRERSDHLVAKEVLPALR